MTRPRILIIYTGGTIGMIENQATGALEPFNFDHLIAAVPKVEMLDYDIHNIQFSKPIDSSDMNPGHWQEIARHIADNYEAYDGFVVLHGTDTMAYTASALSFMFDHLHKPVIITGSQLPIGEVRTDGEENLITALQIAAHLEADGTPTVQEVAILFEDYLWRGNRATKMSADNFNAFKSNNYPRLAHIGLGIVFNGEALMHHTETEPLTVHLKMDPNVLVVTLLPGMTEATLRHQLATPGVRAVVLRTFGAGNCPTEPSLLGVIAEAEERGLVIVNVTQCINGGVRVNRYVGSERLARAGVVSGNDITVEAAVTKLMSLFGRGLSRQEVVEQMQQSIAGEITLPTN
jgi:L-asparaginase